MIVTPELANVDRVEKNIAPPFSLAVTIPLSIDLRHSMMDGYGMIIGLSQFVSYPARDASTTLLAIAKAVGHHTMNLPSFDVSPGNPFIPFPGPDRTIDAMIDDTLHGDGDGHNIEMNRQELLRFCRRVWDKASTAAR
jgi:hypothetical protein